MLSVREVRRGGERAASRELERDHSSMPNLELVLSLPPLALLLRMTASNRSLFRNSARCCSGCVAFEIVSIRALTCSVQYSHPFKLRSKESGVFLSARAANKSLDGAGDGECVLLSGSLDITRTVTRVTKKGLRF